MRNINRFRRHGAVSMMAGLLARTGAEPRRIAPVEELFSHLRDYRDFHDALVAAGKADDVRELATRVFARSIEERLQANKAVIVIWSAEAVKSDWVQSEADTARTDRKLVQLTLDGSKLPRPSV